MARISAFLALVALQADLAAGNLRGLSGTKTCGALFCASDAVCCDRAPAALCGSPGSSCCYNPSMTIANLCAPGWSCNADTGNCHIADTPVHGNNTIQCGALFCAKGSVCCDEAPAALCGAPDSTCCYNPSKTIANLCARGTHCHAETGTCYV
uniref:Granulins domain-containing protein n=1 Tax=Alexandrium andersonii TaxID=327968 RepID=A0A6U6NAW5_9DINO|mmetsp:Transcript_3979/g.8983  ORF Transcript_3979/g.8983 Transcript_3979/m.8983 type:complete len:153 (+) Transcript_3979:89-547(+)